MARVASTTTDEGNLLGELTIRIIVWLVDICLSVESDNEDIVESIKALTPICKASIPAQFEVARLVFAALGSVDNVVYNNLGMQRLLEKLYFLPPVILKTKSKRTVPFHNHVTAVIAQRKYWSDDTIEKLADQLSSLPCTIGVSYWILSLIKALAKDGRIGLLQRISMEIATNISRQFNEILETDTPKVSNCEAARGCATVLSFLLIGYQKSRDLQLLLSDTVSQAVAYAERHPIKRETVRPPYSMHDILKPSRSSIIRLAYSFTASVLHFQKGVAEDASIVTFVYKMLPQEAVVKLTQPEREICFLRGLTKTTPTQPAPLTLSVPSRPSQVSTFRKKIHPGITGLLNLGNTCFMAAYLQAMYFSQPLRRLLLTPHSSPSVENSCWESCKLLKSLSTLFGCMELTKASYLKPQNVYRALPSMFTNYRQHDSSEFGVVLLSSLEREIRSTYGPPGEASHQGSIANFPKQVTGEIVSTTICGKCKTERSMKEDYVGLNLMYGSETVITDVQCLLDSTLDTTENLWGDNKYQCDICNQKTDATKNTYVTRVPNTLILSLGRFRYDPKLGIRRKICTTTRFSESLSVRNKTYTLTSIVAHSGPSSYGGHYYCVAKDPTVGWVECNDSRCEIIDGKVSAAFTRTDVPYILFYTKVPSSSSAGMEEDLYGDCAVDVDSEDDVVEDQPPLELLTELSSFRETAINNPSYLTDSVAATSSSKLPLD
eukprot:TRINITY_DN7049_c2_g1_i1.p1 TRINITY_DN7049_c2_g1~~TRINITY_DN7049_c2_g1_i1.p1  ORF type:complete len:718 (+),score=97.28 TRINITY_DN7049_c2_g1_i1:66-2219(+)